MRLCGYITVITHICQDNPRNNISDTVISIFVTNTHHLGHMPIRHHTPIWPRFPHKKMVGEGEFGLIAIDQPIEYGGLEIRT